MAQKVKIRFYKRNPKGKRGELVMTIVGTGRTKALAKSSATRNARTYVRRNIIAGFHDATGFHPIRASADYSPGRAGEKFRSGGHGRSKGKQRRRVAGGIAKRGGALYSSHF
ncbi:MAG: hypothetical protein ABSF73_03045 [Terriglobia bacterium]|jgi:hypothetical protein